MKIKIETGKFELTITVDDDAPMDRILKEVKMLVNMTKPEEERS